MEQADPTVEDEKMKFVQETDDIWHLVDENAPASSCVIATLKGPIEIIAIKRFCEVFLQMPHLLLDAIRFSHEGHSYSVRPFSDRGNKLSLRIERDDGALWRIETEFEYPIEG